MADEPDDVLDLDEDMVLDPDEDQEQHEDEQGDDEDVVSFGDEPSDPEPEPTDLVKHLRKELRKRDEQLAQTRKAPTEDEIVVGEKPKIADFDYDEDRFEEARDAYDARVIAKRQQDERRQQQERQHGEAWEAVKKNYSDKKAALPFRDKEQIEAKAFEALSSVQQAVIAKVAPDPALFIYAAGKNDARLNSLAAIDDPIVLAHAIGRMGATLKVGKRNQAPEPERVVRGSTVRGGGDKQLEKLEKEADRTGDRTALVKYRKEMRKP